MRKLVTSTESAGWAGARWLAAGTAVFMAAVLALHAALLPGGRWDGDEYFDFSMLRLLGWHFIWLRFYDWSPRPVSELALWLYDGAVTLHHGPLIAPFLALLWSILIGATAAAIWRPRMLGAPWRLAVALSVLAMFLLGHVVNEMFYWPQASAPYLLALAGMAVTALRLIGGHRQTRRDRLILGSALLLAAWSSETGQLFTLGCCGVLLLAGLPDLLRRPAAAVRDQAWFLLPLAGALAMVFILVFFRVTKATAGLDPASPYFHHLGPSLLGTLHSLQAEFVDSDPYRPDPGPYGKLVTYSLLFAGLLASLRAGNLGRALTGRYALALLGGILLSAFGSILAAHFQFGVLCCERHHTFRQCLVVLLVLVLAAIAARFGRTDAPWPRIAGPLCLVAATLISLSTRLPQLINDYGILRTDIQMTAQNWAAEREPGTSMVFHMPVHGQVLEGLAWTPGPVTRDGPGPFYYSAMLRYFGKLTGEVVATPPPEH